MAFDAELAARRFGYGLSPRVPPPATLAAMLDGVGQVDPVEPRTALPPFSHMQDAMAERRRFAYFAQNSGNAEAAADAMARALRVRDRLRADHMEWYLRTQVRRCYSASGFRERLLAFWGDHFTAFGGGGLMPLAGPIYLNEAVRPHLAGRFGDMLFACVTHPLMLFYLDQTASFGPNSRAARLSLRPRGLNENLAREVIELHTLGVEGGYSQEDVQGLAALFTGMGLTRDFSFRYRAARSEPGEKVVLGRRYDAGGMDVVRAALDDLARHPDTARHIARKLAVHFIADDPPEDTVQAIAAAYRESDGDLTACYAAMLEQPSAWAPLGRNMRPPEEFISTALRALAPAPAVFDALELPARRSLFFRPLLEMGQPWLRPRGPDGFDEADRTWVTPPGMAARLEWAMNAPARLLAALPDPAEFARMALGDAVSAKLEFAVGAAESRAVGIGLVLSAPAFQRR